MSELSLFLFGATKALPLDYPGLNAIDPRIVYLMGCSTFEQFCCTWRSIEDPAMFCPFCPAELKRRGRTPKERIGSMIFLENEFPRKDATMGLIVPECHITDPDDLLEAELAHVWRLMIISRRKYGFESGGMVMRYGDPRDHAGTIAHLHWNLIKPTREGGMSVPLAKHLDGPRGHKDDWQRFLDFMWSLGQEGGFEWLFSQAGIEETQPKVVAV